VEGGSGRVAAASGAVLQQEAKARGGLWALHQSGKKTMARFPFKGGPRDAAEGGRGSRVMCGGWNGGERGGPGHGGKWLRRPASAPGWQARAAALPRNSGRRRDVGDTGTRG
jgi:hypothetical protein